MLGQTSTAKERGMPTLSSKRRMDFNAGIDDREFVDRSHPSEAERGPPQQRCFGGSPTLNDRRAPGWIFEFETGERRAPCHASASRFGGRPYVIETRVRGEK